MLLLLIVVQFALWSHAAQVAQLAASTGDRTARSIGGGPAQGSRPSSIGLGRTGFGHHFFNSFVLGPSRRFGGNICHREGPNDPSGFLASGVGKGGGADSGVPEFGMTELRRKSESGSLVVELVVLTPVVFIIALCVLVFGRVSEARQLVTESARAGAQAASVMPNAESAQAAAIDSAVVGTSGQAHACAHAQVVTDVSHYYPGGYVRVTVTCAVALSDLSVPGIPGSTSITESSTAPVDPYRPVQ